MRFASIEEEARAPRERNVISVEAEGGTRLGGKSTDIRPLVRCMARTTGRFLLKSLISLKIRTSPPFPVISR